MQIRFFTRNGFTVVIDNHSNLDPTVISDRTLWISVRPCSVLVLASTMIAALAQTFCAGSRLAECLPTARDTSPRLWCINI